VGESHSPWCVGAGGTGFLYLVKERFADPLLLKAVGALRASRAARIAWSNTSLRFLCVRAEDSTYLTAPIWWANLRAATSDTGCSRYCANSIKTLTSVRRSDCVPTSTMGARGLWCLSSCNHFSRTLWKEVGDTTLKHTRNTSVPG